MSGITLNLDGTVAVVTGASAGIGRGVAEVLSRCGAQLVLVARRGETLTELAKTLVRPSEIEVVPVDLSRAGAARHVTELALQRFGRVDVLVHSAGGSRPLEQSSGDAVWDESFAINFHAARRLAECLLPDMRRRRYGRLITITGSSEGSLPNAASPAKAAVHAWAKALSRVVGADGVTVNSIAPGRIHSEQIDDKLHPDPEARQQFIDTNIPLGYFGEPADIGYLVAFLVSPLGRYITGEVIHVDGGMRRYQF